MTGRLNGWGLGEWMNAVELESLQVSRAISGFATLVTLQSIFL